MLKKRDLPELPRGAFSTIYDAEVVRAFLTAGHPCYFPGSQKQMPQALSAAPAMRRAIIRTDLYSAICAFAATGIPEAESRYEYYLRVAYALLDEDTVQAALTLVLFQMSGCLPFEEWQTSMKQLL